MVCLKRLLVVMFVSFIFIKGGAQVFKPKQLKKIIPLHDTLVLDSLSLVPGSINFTEFPKPDSLNATQINYKLHALIFKKKPDSILVFYKRFPYNFENNFFHKNPNSLLTDLSRPNNPFTINYNTITKQTDLLQNDGLNKNGNISRGISFGNNQDVVVNSNLNLQVSGKLTPEIDMVLAATDNNIPFQADGTTAQLQEFDKVYIQLNNATTKLVVGDYQLGKPATSYFMSFYKRAQGAYLENVYRDSTSKKPLVFKTQVAGAVSKGKFSRQVFFGTENNQGPYRLKGANNEPFIIVLSGTEKIYIDGKLLQRGQENDYIVDYNTGELTFTARQQITKDKRIVAEFQYAERNYARSLFMFSEEIQSKKTGYYLNFFSEQDNKNRPLQQNLSQGQKNVLIAVGDTLDKAVYSGAELATFNNSDVFYWKKDTTVSGTTYYPIYVHSLNADSAKYRLKFSNVGTNKGNYNQISSTANGKVYVWVAPVGGIPQGSYEPVIPLVTPKQIQMLTGGINYSLTENNYLNVEGVYTKNDINTFSPSNKANDDGSGVKITSKNEKKIISDSIKSVTKFIYNANYEFIQKQFNQIERFRSIEFDRDWNRPLNSVILNDQHIASGELGLVKTNGNTITYNIHFFNEGSNYRGTRNNLLAKYSRKKSAASYTGSYLTTNDNLNSQITEFYRHKTSLSQKVDKLKFAYNDVFENNVFKNSFNKVLLPKAYQFWEWEGSVSNADSSKNSIKLFYKERSDKLNYGGVLKDSTYARNIGIQSSIYSIKNNPVTVLITYRQLELKNIVGTSLKPDNTLLNRLEYNPRYFKGLITSNVFYETGYGVENKREFYYLEVAAGQGQYAWNDYNGNGIKELNEFEVSQFSDQARYIRIYTPTNQYIKVLQNQVSISATIRPSSFIKQPKKFAGKFVNRWVIQAIYRKDNKTSDNKDANNYNPFYNAADSLLLSKNNNIRGSLFFNQSSAVFGADYTYINNQSKQLLTNGIEGRNLKSQEIKWRVSFLKAWAINSNNVYCQKSNASQFFNNRNFYIEGYDCEEKLIFQPNSYFRLSGIYKYAQKENKIEGGFQKAYINTYAVELKYNQTEKGSLSARADYINITFNDLQNSALAYEMLNALNAGKNYTWEISYQRNLSNNLQISINYNGRKTPNANPVHIGGAQIRAFF